MLNLNDLIKSATEKGANQDEDSNGSLATGSNRDLKFIPGLSSGTQTEVERPVDNSELRGKDEGGGGKGEVAKEEKVEEPGKPLEFHPEGQGTGDKNSKEEIVGNEGANEETIEAPEVGEGDNNKLTEMATIGGDGQIRKKSGSSEGNSFADVPVTSASNAERARNSLGNKPQPPKMGPADAEINKLNAGKTNSNLEDKAATSEKKPPKSTNENYVQQNRSGSTNNNAERAVNAMGGNEEIKKDNEAETPASAAGNQRLTQPDISEKPQINNTDPLTFEQKTDNKDAAKSVAARTLEKSGESVPNNVMPQAPGGNTQETTRQKAPVPNTQANTAQPGQEAPVRTVEAQAGSAENIPEVSEAEIQPPTGVVTETVTTASSTPEAAPQTPVANPEDPNNQGDMTGITVESVQPANITEEANMPESNAVADKTQVQEQAPAKKSPGFWRRLFGGKGGNRNEIHHMAGRIDRPAGGEASNVRAVQEEAHNKFWAETDNSPVEENQKTK